MLDDKLKLFLFSCLLIFIFSIGSAAFARDDLSDRLIKVPNRQLAVVKIIDDARAEYADCENALKCSSVIKRRDKAIAANLENANFTNWIGRIKTLDTTSDGDAIVRIQAFKTSIDVGTWNNSLSDVMDETLIKNGSKMYDRLAEMEIDDLVVFSGRFIREGSLTEAGNARAPHFIVRFSDVRWPVLDDTMPKEKAAK